MDKLIKTILIFSISVIGVGFLLALPARAVEVDELIVEYSSDGGTSWLPLSAAIFSETNFLPGQDVTRLIRVTNNSEPIQRIAIEAINFIKPVPETDLSRALMIVIKQGATEIYGGAGNEKTLYQFYQNGETYLSDLVGGTTTQYNITISFPPGTGNEWQSKNTTKTTQFNILVGFEGTEGGLPLPSPGGGTGGGGGGGGLPSGLTIFNEAQTTVATTNVTIDWDTSYPATSWVIYAIAGEEYEFNLASTTYGYPHAYPNPEDAAKVTHHSVTISGLTPGTTYHYRCVSHASLAISTEHSFTTLNILSNAPSVSVAVTAPTSAAPSESTATTQSAAEEQTEQQPAEQPVAQTATQNSLVATIGGFLTLGTGSVWLGILIGLIILAIIVYAIYALIQRKRKNLGSV